MKHQQLSGVILHSKTLFEKDKHLTLFSKGYGKCTVLAKGAQTKNYAFSGVIDVGNYVEISIYKGKSFYLLTDCKRRGSFQTIRGSFNRISMMLHFFDIVRKSTSYEQKNDGLFDCLVTSLEHLNTSDPIDRVQENFYGLFLATEGLLASTTKTIPKEQFKQAYETYTGRPITFPHLINESLSRH